MSIPLPNIVIEPSCTDDEPRHGKDSKHIF